MLIEIMVSLSIFTLIAVSTTAALLSIMDANNKSQSMRAVMDNLSVTVESMSRALRVGTNFSCNFNSGYTDFSTCGSGTNVVSFQPQNTSAAGDRIVYKFENNAIVRYKASSPSSPTILTSADVSVTNLTFYVLGAGKCDGQPRMLITINGKAGGTLSPQSTFVIQTTVSQRQIDDDADPSTCPQVEI
jgi:type II secretory pathway pseudopilin PulG